MLSLIEIQDFKGKFPKQIWYLFFTEMWERFCFYGNRGMLVIFMTDILLIKEDVANLKYGAIQAFVYAFTFIGGLFADKILGFQRSLLWGGILMVLGSVVMGLDAQHFFFYGICLIIVGTGFLSQIFQRWLVNCTEKVILVAMRDLVFSMQELISVRCWVADYVFL